MRKEDALGSAELDSKIREMAGRIRALREIENLTPAAMAEKTGVTEEAYLACESGKADLNFAFIYCFPSFLYWN